MGTIHLDRNPVLRWFLGFAFRYQHHYGDHDRCYQTGPHICPVFWNSLWCMLFEAGVGTSWKIIRVATVLPCLALCSTVWWAVGGSNVPEYWLLYLSAMVGLLVTPVVVEYKKYELGQLFGRLVLLFNPLAGYLVCLIAFVCIAILLGIFLYVLIIGLLTLPLALLKWLIKGRKDFKGIFFELFVKLALGILAIIGTVVVAMLLFEIFNATMLMLLGRFLFYSVAGLSIALLGACVIVAFFYGVWLLFAKLLQLCPWIESLFAKVGELGERFYSLICPNYTP